VAEITDLKTGEVFSLDPVTWAPMLQAARNVAHKIGPVIVTYFERALAEEYKRIVTTGPVIPVISLALLEVSVGYARRGAPEMELEQLQRVVAEVWQQRASG
jgi:hypothetical protein